MTNLFQFTNILYNCELSVFDELFDGRVETATVNNQQKAQCLLKTDWPIPFKHACKDCPQIRIKISTSFVHQRR